MTPDDELEARIDLARIALVRARNDRERAIALHAFTMLVAQRSPQQVEKMEREKGLR